jgi:hypothetical protein
MILTGDHTRVVGMIDRLALEVKGLIQACQDIATYSKGGMDYHIALQMSAFERDLAIEGINKRIEAAAKTPFGNMML